MEVRARKTQSSVQSFISVVEFSWVARMCHHWLWGGLTPTNLKWVSVDFSSFAPSGPWLTCESLRRCSGWAACRRPAIQPTWPSSSAAISLEACKSTVRLQFPSTEALIRFAGRAVQTLNVTDKWSNDANIFSRFNDCHSYQCNSTEIVDVKMISWSQSMRT
jgi:hypothetical protein